MKAKVEVFTSPTCPHCPSAKRIAEEISKEREDVHVMEFSTASDEGSKKAKVYGIMSVPTIIIKGTAKEFVGLRGTPSKNGFNKAIDLALEKEEWNKDNGFFEKFKGIFS